MPNGSQIWTTFKGYLDNIGELPSKDNRIGDMYATGKYAWVWTTDATGKITWVDP